MITGLGTARSHLEGGMEAPPLSLKTLLPLCMRCFINIPSWMNNMHYTREISAAKLACKTHLPGLHPQIAPALAFCTAFSALSCRQRAKVLLPCMDMETCSLCESRCTSRTAGKCLYLIPATQGQNHSSAKQKELGQQRGQLGTAWHAKSRAPGLLLVTGQRKTLVCVQFPLLLLL